MKKRIALGVVAALAGGLLAAAPASATSVANAPFTVTVAQSFNTGANSATETATAVAGANNFVQIGATGTGDTTTIGSTFTLTGGTFVSTNVGTLNTAKTEITFDSTTIAGAAIKIATPSVGTITAVYKAYSQSGGQVTFTTGQTFTITVIAAVTSTLYDNTKLSAIETASATSYVDEATVPNVYAPKGTVGSPAVAAKMTATQYANAAQTTTTADASAKAMTATITGVGLISETNTTTGLGTYLAWSAETKGARTVYVYSDGRAGVAKVTWTVDGKEVGSKTMTFFGSAAKYVVTNNNPHIVGTAGETGTVTVLAKDSNDVVVPNVTIYATSGTTAAATIDANATTSTAADALGEATFVVTAVAAGSSTLTFANSSTTASVTVSATSATKVTKAEVATVTMAFDKATYAPGEKAIITVTLKDANSDLMGDYGDGTGYAVFAAAATSTQALQGSLPAASVVTASGVKTYTVYMPVVAGPVSVSATTASAAPVAAAQQGKVLTASASVVVPASAAETANAAAIATLNTAVATLQTTVASLVASMTAQIKVINAALVKIAKKLKVKI